MSNTHLFLLALKNVLRITNLTSSITLETFTIKIFKKNFMNVIQIVTY